MRLASDIGQFLSAVIAAWAALLTGGILIAALFVFEKISKREIPRSVYLVVIISTLFVAFFLAWRKERDEKIAAETRLEHLTVPKLSGEIVFWAAAPATNPVGVIASVRIRIQNQGAPTIIKNPSVRIVGRQPHEVFEADILPNIGGPITLSGNDGKSGFLWTPDEYLLVRAGQSPIPTGGAVEGFLIALATGAKPEEMFPGGYPEVLFDDIRGQRYAIKGNPAGSHSKAILNPFHLQEPPPNQPK